MSIRRSLAWMLASQGGLFFLQFAGSVALARLLTPYEMGVYAIAAALIGVIGIVQAFGLALFVIREAEAGAETLASTFTMNIVLSVVLSGTIVLLSAFGGFFLHEQGVRNVMLVLAIIPLIGIFEFRPLTMIEREGEFRAIASLNVVRAVSSTAVTITLAFMGQSYMSIAWGGVAGSLSVAIGATILGWRHVGFQISTSAWRRVLRFGLQQLAIQGVNAISARLAEFILGRLLGLEALGIWGRANNLNNLVWNSIHAVVGRVMMVNLSEQNRLGQSLRPTYLRTVEVLTAVLWPSFAGLAILAGPFISIVYGPAWVAAAAPLAGLALTSMVMVSLTMSWEVFVVCRETSRQAKLEYLRTSFGLVLFIGGCLLNLTMAAVARVAEATFSVVMYRSHVQRMTDTRWADYRAIYQRSAIITAAACSPALALMVGYGWSPQAPASLVALTVALGGSFWLLALKALDHPLAEEVSRVLIKGRQSIGLT